jgi:diguanylate cyclase
MGIPATRRLADWALGTDPRQRLRARQALLVIGLDSLLAGVAAFGVWAGIMSWSGAVIWVAFQFVGIIGFYVVVRSGLSLRLSEDPALTLPQGVYSVLSCALAYAICGPVRGATLLTMAVTLVVSMFALRPKQVRGLALFAIATLGMTMLGSHLVAPARFPAHEEVMNFMMAAVLLPSIALLAGQLSTMRLKLQQHRQALEQALEQNRQLAIRDELTGLYNRRHVMSLMHAEALRAARHGRSLAIVMIDLDHFKRINDTHGHALGDEVLKAFALVATAALRESDTLGRWGGEEFIVMLPETDEVTALRVMARVQAQAKGLRFPSAQELCISFSAGVAICRPGEALNDAIERADEAMYRAKESGRDRCLAAPQAVKTPALARPQQPVPSSAP